MNILTTPGKDTPTGDHYCQHENAKKCCKSPSNISAYKSNKTKHLQCLGCRSFHNKSIDEMIAFGKICNATPFCQNLVAEGSPSSRRKCEGVADSCASDYQNDALYNCHSIFVDYAYPWQGSLVK